MAQVGTLYTSLTLESSSFVVGLKKAVDQTQASAARIQESFEKVINVAETMAAALALEQAAELAKRALEYAATLGEVSQQLGVTSQDLQVYRYAAGQVGISQDEMDKGLQKLTRTIGEAAAGQAKQAGAFRELGVSVTDANGRLLTAGEVIPRVADALEKIKDPAARARFEVELFGKTGQQLDTLLADGSGAIDNMRKAAQDLGIVLDEDAIRNADRTADKLDELKTVLEANIAKVVADNAGAIYDLANSFEHLASSIPAATRAWKEWKLENAINFKTGMNRIPGMSLLPNSISGTDTSGDLADLAELRIQDQMARLGLGGSILPHAAPRAGGLPPLSGGHGRGGGRSRKDEVDDLDKALQNMTRDTDAALKQLDRLLEVNPDDALAENTRKFFSAHGIDPNAGVGDLIKQHDARIDANMRVTEDYYDRQSEKVREVAHLYTDLMRGGTRAFLDDFKQIGIAIVAQMIARLTMGQNLSSSFHAAVQAVLPGGLPGFADGGSLAIAGFGGVDRNLLSLNGQPVARVSQGERIDIRNPSRGGGGITVNVDARGATNPAEVKAIAQRAVMEAAPVLIEAAKGRTIAFANRPTLPGSLG